jgi:hypothetical protein
VVAADKESAEAKAINNLMVVAVEKLTYNMSAIEAVSVKQIKKTRITTPIIRKEDREATLDMIKLANGQCYNSGGVDPKIDVLTRKTPYKYVIDDNGYTYLKLNTPNGENIFSYHTRIAIDLLKMGLLTTSLNLTLDEINVQSALGTDPKKLFKSGSLSWDDKMLSYYDIKRPEDRVVKGMLKMVRGMVV